MNPEKAKIFRAGLMVLEERLYIIVCANERMKDELLLLCILHVRTLLKPLFNGFLCRTCGLFSGI